MRVGVPGLESGHGGSLRASRVFTNEGSKKEKRGLEGQADPLLEKRPREEHGASPPQQGIAGKGGPSVQRRGVSSRPTPCSDSTLKSPHSSGV